jgi:hypothetical protein
MMCRPNESMAGRWKKQEKRIRKLLLNTKHMYSSIGRIAGRAIGRVALREPPDATAAGPPGAWGSA